MKCSSCGNRVSLLFGFTELPKYDSNGEKIRLCHKCRLSVFRGVLYTPQLAHHITKDDLEELEKSLKWAKDNKDKIEEEIKKQEDVK